MRSRSFTAQLTLPACSAEVALDRRDEMDVPGWKVGDPCVVLHPHRFFDRVDDVVP